MQPTDYFTASDGDAAVVGDNRSFPVLIATWFGEPNESLVRGYFAWSDAVAQRAFERDERYIIVSDNTQALRPAPAVRKLITALIEGGPAAKTDRVIASYVVFESALVRGAVTAMQWLSGRDWNLITTPTVQTAIDRALAMLDKAGVERPAGLVAATYACPRSPAQSRMGSGR